ncbi:MAG TPA: acyltransferase [Phycisphaerales bacterium]|nr:acyltransferase [Phycisphaerales bacterium]
MAAGIRSESSLAYIPGLDGVRALSVLAVIAFHFTASWASRLEAANEWWTGWTHLTRIGWTGVDVFFVISGFLIARVLARRPVRTLREYAAFLLRRARRLLPAYIACLLLVTLIAVICWRDSKVLANCGWLWTLSANVVLGFGDRAALVDANLSMVHFWSLAVEWHFYAVFPLVLLFSRSSTRAALILVALAVACRVTFMSAGLSDNATYAFTLCRIDALAMGVLLAAWIDRGSERTVRIVASVGAASFVAMLIVLAFTPGSFKPLVWVQSVGYTLLAASAAMMLAGLIRFPQCAVTRLLEAAPLTAIGRASYSLYIWHLVFLPFITAFVAAKWPHASVGQTYLITTLIATVVTAGLAVVSYRLLEAAVLSRRSLGRRTASDDASLQR